MKRLGEVVEAMSSHDSNEERRYLREGRFNVTWSWLWRSWLFGGGVEHDPYSTERWSAYIGLGPVVVEVYWRTER